jgi:hypothetical protein
MALYKAHTKEGAKLRKYYKHNTILKLLQFNPKKNNILSYFIKDIINPLELKKYKQIRNKTYIYEYETKEHQIIITYDNITIFSICRNHRKNYITNVYKINSPEYKLYRLIDKNIFFAVNEKMQKIFITFSKITFTNIAIRCKNIWAGNRVCICSKADISVYYIYIKNIRYKNEIILYLPGDNYNTFTINIKIFYRNEKKYLRSRFSPVIMDKIFYYKPIIIIPNKYELHFISKLINLLIC